MAGGVQCRIIVQHRLALLHLKIFRTTVLILVVQMLLIVSISASASKKDGLLGFPWVWFESIHSSGNEENRLDTRLDASNLESSSRRNTKRLTLIVQIRLSGGATAVKSLGKGG